MFTGNAKTHFQVLGRHDNAQGYMMSPFGDERWDIDDNEKLRKIFKKPDGPNQINYDYRTPTQNYQYPQPMANFNPSPPHQQGKQSYYGYIHQSGTAQGYMPKSEVLPNAQPQYPPQAAQPQVYQNYYQNQSTVPSQPQQTPNHLSQQTQHHYYQSSSAPAYRQAAVKHHNGLNQDEIKHRSRITYTQPHPQKFESQSLEQIPRMCGQCQQGQDNKVSDAYYSQRNWKASSDVPVWIAGGAAYRPFGPMEATPNPYYPPREKSTYMPLC